MLRPLLQMKVIWTDMESIFTPPSNASDSVKGSSETLIEMWSKVKLESL